MLQITLVRRISGILLIAAAGSLSVAAQSRISPYVLVQGGGIAGTSGGALGEAAAGLRDGRWGWGLATGIDNAGITSIPLVADIRWSLIPKRHVEIFSQEGWNVVTQKSAEFDRFSNGVFWYGGLTVRLFTVKKAGGLWISAGVRYKQYGEQKSFFPPGPESFGGDGDLTHTTYRSGGAIVTIGWRL